MITAATATFAFTAGSADAAPHAVSDWTSLAAEVAAGHDVTLAADISHSGTPLVISTKKSVALDLNGHKLTIDNGSSAGQPAIVLPSGSRFVPEDLTGGGELDATGGSGAAGIEVKTGASLRIHDGVVHAVGGTGGAGIGGNASETPGLIEIRSGDVTATGGTGGAGIGGGSNGDGTTVRIDGVQVVATGGDGGAGIGGGVGGAAGTLSLPRGTTFANGGTGAAAVGAGAGGGVGNAAVQVGSDAMLVVTGGTGASTAITLGSLNNAGILRVPSGTTVTLPDGVIAENSGLIRLYGKLVGPGTIHNTGTILPTISRGNVGDTGQVSGNGQGPAGSSLLVSDHNYTISFVLDGANGNGTAPATMHVYAATIDDARQALPGVPTISGYTSLGGWYTTASGNTKMANDTVVGTVADYGPSSLVLHARYEVASSSTSPSTPTSTAPSTSDSSGIGGVSASRSDSGGAGVDAVSASRSDSALASTGFDTGPTLTVALMLLGGGLVCLLLGGRARSVRGARKH